MTSVQNEITGSGAQLVKNVVSVVNTECIAGLGTYVIRKFRHEMCH